ncbi:MAG: bifunctional 4-hydroxy-2-oxoglutarate aldolase/2-dehydro-3-deoxy-phosphogluconate aldolase [Algoriphagus sp.]|jgi:2-dehydro-3-deoxyphosphogluconate aldolase / (4S)-4-hydroxy-2-oxoglutarate aldolase|uniref:bifunctional 4-hydroxy-2-oxoglutarate aldolase/2-dehydro-3-deoxy-phosphogluconate aldolase n=1 Tax=Algoriphagus sp. TaxID=1872435 RepID=UPI00274472F7|nr:bifunctional 4-hydroxy-2-oxoglutarate aldolase/2-dehydro-3-deoxy-phosphogluconate aldolase [Algoriphagus sp.]MDP4747673.1 bifunctional 4-hydroxy-2-oxoglutarate aldolase/2-dehydro-3-deoxy-phosphogluconate aldolase [Algoriphagus sp.]MDP4839436.1 bifunctional 4-hydroxy-2-oxoglutarate aldolase/2-dehydro-3-deoxy-phosphogluconate aldolase [Algoriphagus sp.]MDP4903758.1 bifunctional 4-hydroxy-2-oxoglutarate aldolase/2-dehydro-3-deoxy-phosphogluconate aldolase [Algoriphagus sp.]MDP4957252.1 bifuncti
MIRNPSPFIQRMHAGGMMPIFFHPEEQVCLELVKAAYEGGVRVIEMVNRGKEVKAIFPKVKELVGQLPGMYLGVGTIYHPEEAQLFLDLGAEFIVAPVMNPALGKYCAEVGVPWIPGCGTVSEIFFAQELGAELVKMYPANLLTPSFISAVHAVMPKIELIPTGGVEPTLPSIKSWFDAGALCVGMGSQLFRKEDIAAGNYSKISETIAQVMAHIASLRNLT